MGLQVIENDWGRVAPRSIVMFSAHGSPANFAEIAEELDCLSADLSCPLVIGNQNKVLAGRRRGAHIVVVGKPGHPEERSYFDRGTPEHTSTVYRPEDVDKLVIEDGRPIRVVTQTTLAVRRMGSLFTNLAEKYPGRIQLPMRMTADGVVRGDICGATDYRQQAVVGLLEQDIDAAVVIGSEGSHNSHELALIAEEAQKPVVLVDRVAKLQAQWFEGMSRIGITAGASAGREDVPEFVEYFRKQNPDLHVWETAKVDPNEKDYFPWTGRAEFYAQLDPFLARHYPV